MALCRKCDRCGKYYDHYPTGDETQNNAIRRVSRRQDNGSYSQDKILDLCPDCMSEFDIFMTVIQFKGERYNPEIENMRVKDLKHILEQLPDDMAVIMPVVDEEDANHIYGFRYFRTAGILISDGEQDREVLCLNASADGYDIADQVYFSGRDVGVKKVLYGMSKYEEENKGDFI